MCQKTTQFHKLVQNFGGSASAVAGFPRRRKLFPPTLAIEKGTEFYSSHYNSEIQSAVASNNFNCHNTVASHSVEYKGTRYKQGLFLPLSRNDDGVVFGRIELILVHQDSEVFFITKKFQSLLHVDSGLYGLCCLGGENQVQLVKHETLLDYYPLPEYKFNELCALAGHHAF